MAFEKFGAFHYLFQLSIMIYLVFSLILLKFLFTGGKNYKKEVDYKKLTPAQKRKLIEKNRLKELADKEKLKKKKLLAREKERERLKKEKQEEKQKRKVEKEKVMQKVVSLYAF